MSTTVGEAFVKIRPDTRGFKAEAEGGVSSAASGLSKVFGAVALAGGALAGARFLKGTIDDFVESRKVGALTEAVIKSTGGAANVTAKQMGDLATKLSMVSGVDDEVIQSSENVLATFTKVQNQVGKGNDIFSRGEKAALNMSAALGTDLQGSTIQLGKALNDPIKGITALSRAGVSFTAQQKEQIKAMVAAGDTLGAQKLILGELEKEFGGAAAAAANPIDKLKVVLGNAKETIGGAIFPVIEQIAPLLGAAASSIAPIIAKGLGAVVPLIKPVLGALLPVFGTIVNVVSTFAAKFGPVLGQVFSQVGATVGKVFAELQPVLPKLAESFSQVGTGVIQSLLPAVPVLGQVAVAGAKLLAAIPPPVLIALVDAFIAFRAVKGALGPIDQVAGVLTKVITPVSTLTKSLGPLTGGIRALGVAIAANPIGAIIVGVTLLVAGVILLYQHFKPFRELVDSVGRALLGVLRPAIDFVVDAFNTLSGAIGDVFDFVSDNWPTILAILTGPFGIAVDLIVSNWDAITGAFSDGIGFVTGLLEGIGSTIGDVLGWFAELPGRILGVLVAAPTWLVNTGVQLITGLVTGLVNTVGNVLSWFVALPGRILGTLAGFATLLVQKGIDLLIGMGNGIVDGAGKVLSWLAGLPGRIVRAIGNVAEALLDVGRSVVRGIRHGIENAWDAFVGWLKSLITGGLVDEIKSWLHIGSPSKVMADQIGAPIVQGIQAGIASSWGGLTRDLNGRVSRLTNGIDLGGTFTPGVGSTFGTNPTAGRSVVIAQGAIVQHIGEGADLATLRQANGELVAALTSAFTVEA